MNNYNEKEEKKGGFLSALSGLFRGGSSVAGSASSGAGSAAGGLGGLFATKAGIVGLVLGGATIATGVGVVYNFVGSSSKPVYSPELFQNSYYEEEASRAGLERSNARDSSPAASSTLDMFREQAKKDGLGGLASEAGEGASSSSEAPATADASADAAAAAPGADAGAAGGGAKLQASAGFGGKGGGGGGGSSGTSIPRMQAGGGLAGGIGAQFQSVYRPPAQASGGKLGGMTASAAARVSSSPKYAVRNTNKKGAFGQAKFANKLSGQAASYGGEQSASRATEAMSGETSGSGEVGTGATGTGLGGAGVSDGAALKGSDPSLNKNDSTVPPVSDPEKDNPWQKNEDMALYGMLTGVVLLVVANILSKKALAAGLATPPGITLLAWASGFAYAAIAAALFVMYNGLIMITKYDQKMMGGVYIAAGAVLIMKAFEAMNPVAPTTPTTAP